MVRVALPILVLLAAAAVASTVVGCRSRTSRGADVQAPAPTPPSWDDRENAAIRGSGGELPDVERSPDSGPSDAEASLLDEALCREACDHLFALLIAEQSQKFERDEEMTQFFARELETIRPKKTKSCIADCRKYADLRAVECVKSARDRTSLDRCDF